MALSRLQAVIGANYGDEGKGVITDYLSDARTLVVRYNGGAQAGHTVKLPLGYEHVFHHFGAGTFQGATTLLTRDFICNPITFLREHASLKSWAPEVFVDNRALVTTPFDMMINQAIESKRGAARHGSCGLGINETVTRCSDEAFSLTIEDVLASDGDIYADLTAMQMVYLPKRCEEIGIRVPAIPDRLVRRFMDDVALMMKFVNVIPDVELLARHEDDIIFEGAQGLALDEVRGIFPHVTRSRTGLINITRLIHEAGMCIEPLRVHYVTRAYTTRHGAGPLDHEVSSGFRRHDWNGPEHNETNTYQGMFRYGLLDPYTMTRRIFEDMTDSHQDVCVLPTLAITCLDQLGSREETNIVGATGLVREVTSLTLPMVLSEVMGLPVGLESHGPTRDTVGMHDDRVRNETL